MKLRRRRGLAALTAALVLLSVPCVRPQSGAEGAPPAAPVIESLELAPATVEQLQHAVNQSDYVAAEKLLLPEIGKDAHSPRAARLLAYIGVIYFRDQDYTNAAVAWKKSEAIAPLDPTLRFSLAMAFIHMNRAEWARQILESLASQNANEALYPYWLGRIDYDGHEYERAIQHFEHAIQLDGSLARAYDNLGLCYFYENQNELALTKFQKAIELERASDHPSPWPYLNIAVTEQFLNRSAEAEKNLREALRLDPNFTKAHFQLGTVLEDLGRSEEALKEFRRAAELDPAYAEPHMAMARLLHKLGQESAAREETRTYLRLHPHSTP